MRDDTQEHIDPLGAARGVADRLLANASTFVDEVVASDGFSETLARGMQGVVTVTSSLRRRVNAVGDFAAEWLNIPTRRQLIDLALQPDAVDHSLEEHLAPLLDNAAAVDNESLAALARGGGS